MSHDSIDELYARWQRTSGPAETAALCEALRSGRRPDLVATVGSHAAKQGDVGAMLAAGRMYADCGRLEDAQGVLVAAGRLAPTAGEVYRWLGDVLLRRGDAERAEKVFEKALQFGADRAALAPLVERARALVPTQQAAGPMAVADAFARAVAPTALALPSLGRGSLTEEDIETRLAAPDLARKLLAEDEETETRTALPDLSRKSLTEEDVETLVRKEKHLRASIDAALAPAMLGSSALPAAGAPPPLPAPPPLTPPPPPPSPVEELVFSRPARSLGFDLPPSQTRDNERAGLVEPATGAGAFVDPRAKAATAAFGSPGGPAPRAPEPPVNPLLLAAARPAPQLGGAPIPEARDVLQALQIAGVFEKDGATAPPVIAWVKPEAPRRIFSLVTLIALALGLVGGGSGTYYYVTKKRAREHLEAEQLVAKVDKDLRTSDAKLLSGSETTLARAFELDSRSPHASLTWLHERVLVGLLKGGADIAFEDATTRAKALGVEEKKIAFAYAASFLFQGDTAGAAIAIAKWDAAAQEDAWFQLVAGATFERAGDPRAIERYSAAVKLDPELIVAQYLLTRATAVDGDPRRANELAKEFKLRYPTRPEGPALVVLAWTRDQVRGEEPSEVREVTEKGDELPVGLRSVPHAARALLALHKGSIEEARPALQRGLDRADTPGMAAWLGTIALATGDEGLARKAALAAVSFSAVYPPARALAARVALLGGRLDEALKAVEDLPRSSIDVEIVTAGVAYERLDVGQMDEAFYAATAGVHGGGGKNSGPLEEQKSPRTPVMRGLYLLRGDLGNLGAERAKEMASDDAPWADLVAMDWALDSGDLDLAKKIADGWRGEPRSMRAVRLARLARYDGRLEDADRLSKGALETGTVTMRVLTERVFTLVALKRDADALALFKTYPNVGGPLAKWLRAYATAAHGKVDDARAIVAQEDPPPAAAAMPARIIAASAYAAMKDVKHGGDFTKPIVQAGFANPDVAFAAEKLNAGKFPKRGK